VRNKIVEKVQREDENNAKQRRVETKGINQINCIYTMKNKNKPNC